MIATVSAEPLSASTPVNASSAAAPATALFILIAGAGVVMLASLAILIWQMRRRKDDEPEHEQEAPDIPWIWKLMATVLPFALGCALVAAAVLGTRSAHNTPRFDVGGAFARPHPAHSASPGAGSGFVLPGWLPWTVLAIVIAALVAGVLWMVYWRRPAEHAPAEIVAASAAVDAAIGALEADAEPRRAVIAAYLAMQRALAAHGVARLPAEAPREYLARALAASTATDREATTLTGLFEEARFSVHPIPARARTAALTALGSLRSRLRSGERA